MSDQYTQASGAGPALSEKLDALRAFVGRHKIVMLVTRAPGGALHSRCMAIADITPDWKIRFIYDNESYKDTEVGLDDHVNIAINGMDKNDGWASIAGKASRNNEEGLVAQLYNPSLKAWFGDKGDGVRNGEPSDPRMTVLEVKIDEVRHFHQTKTSIGTAVDVVASAITGSVATPGEVRTITGQEIAQAWAKGELKEP